MGTALLSIGVRAMAASYASMQTTSHNIANASVQGYSRQETLLATSQGQFTGAGFFGRGVDVAGVKRTQDAFLTREAATAKALAAKDAVRATYLDQLQTAFRTGEQGIGHAISQFFAATSDLASRPADAASRQVVLARAHDLAMRFQDAGTQLAQVQTGVTQDLRASVQAVNGIAASIARVNNDIAAARGLGQEPNDLLDERDRLISQLSEHVQVSTIPAEDGTVGVFMAGGERLVLGATAEKLTLVADAFDPSRSAVAISEGATNRRLAADALGGGRIAGLLRFQNEDIVAAQVRLGQLAYGITDAVNRQQMLGMNLLPPAGTVPSPALFGLEESAKGKVFAASSNRSVPGDYLLEMRVVDASQLQASEYELRADPASPGAWVVQRVPDDGSAPVSIVPGTTLAIDGMEIDFDILGTVPGTDRFLIAPVTRAAIGMRTALSDPLGLAAASPFVADAPATNTGSMAVQALRMVQAPTDPTGNVVITFTGPDPGDPSRMLYSWSRGAASGSGSWAPGKTIPAPPDPDINGFALTLSGVPAVGDTIELAPTPFPALNNGNALALNELGGLNLIGLEAPGGGTPSGGFTFNDAFVGALADVGVRAQGAEAAAAISSARAGQSEQARVDKAGVNLDEEAARLIQFQQSYQAAAKVLQIAQSVFSELLQIAGG
ncbi:MAG: flagellar hook-associated protein FlgK [Rubrivivax sp. SCN 71-131]|jgi:flagellar hook-associated protein 1 FlgK|nr:MAG: flagellar hook-associated protein FlgK [Rubrivivax sp. SCN 71-131]